MRQPKGISLEIGLNSKMVPSVYLGPQAFKQIRPVATEIDIVTGLQKFVRNTFGGLKIDISIGTVLRPVRKPWKWRTSNPWTSGNHWFVLRIPILPTFFISLSLGKRGKQYGLYFGFKTYEVNPISNAGNWAKEREVGNVYLCPSASIRETFWN